MDTFIRQLLLKATFLQTPLDSNIQDKSDAVWGYKTFQCNRQHLFLLLLGSSNLLNTPACIHKMVTGLNAMLRDGAYWNQSLDLG